MKLSLLSWVILLTFGYISWELNEGLGDILSFLSVESTAIVGYLLGQMEDKWQ